jgi:hypothetical protein
MPDAPDRQEPEDGDDQEAAETHQPDRSPLGVPDLMRPIQQHQAILGRSEADAVGRQVMIGGLLDVVANLAADHNAGEHLVPFQDGITAVAERMTAALGEDETPADAGTVVQTVPVVLPAVFEEAGARPQGRAPNERERCKSMVTQTRRSNRAQREARVSAVIGEIRAAQRQAKEQESGHVGCQLRLSGLLDKLRQEAGKRWTYEAQRVGYDPAAARRLAKLGAGRWFTEADDADLLRRLPADLRKLGQLARLSRADLLALLDRMDPKTASLKQIREAVRTILGTARKARPKASGRRRLMQATARLLVVLRNLDADPSLGGHLTLPRAILADAAERMETALAKTQSQAVAGTPAG